MENIIPNYKTLSERLQEEKEYFDKLFEKINNGLTIPQFKDLQKYLKAFNAIVDARQQINSLEHKDEDLFNELRIARNTVENNITNMLKSFLSEEEIEYILYIFDLWIINGKASY